MKKSLCILALLPMAFLSAADPVAAPPASPNSEEAVLKQVQLLNQVPEDQLNDKTDPGFSLLKSLYDEDGPDFLTLRKLLGKAAVRSTLNPSAKGLLAGVISQRWDTFVLSGNLYLAGLRSANSELKDKARKKLVGYIQPAHIPVLIDLLKVPGPNVLAYDILQEVTGQRLDPTVKVWKTWWEKGGSKVDMIGHLLADTRTQAAAHRVHAVDQERFWYLPAGIKDAQISYAKRRPQEQTRVSDWNNWANTDVKHYVEEWAPGKPLLERLIHQPDPRVNAYLETLVNDPGQGDYASVILAWRSSVGSLDAIRTASQSTPTVGRILARGSLGDATALDDLLQIIERHQAEPLTYKIMDDEVRSLLPTLRTVGIIPAEKAFELLSHTNFDFEAATTAKEKKKAFKNARDWLKKNASRLTLDKKRGFYTVSSADAR